jgi:hypothetical protein
MNRAAALFLLLLPACAGTQSAAAFTLRSASPETPVVEVPNKAGAHDQALASSLDRSLEQQEKQDRVEDLLAKNPGDGTGAAGAEKHAPAQVTAAR